MAQKLVVELIDDLDGDPIDVGGESIEFAVNGVQYTIDLNEKNAIEFHRKLDYYIRHAARVGGRKTTRQVKDTPDRAMTQTIRAWAHANGYAVSARGKIAASLVEAYTKAH